MRQAAATLAAQGLCDAGAASTTGEMGAAPAGRRGRRDPRAIRARAKFAEALFELRKAKGMTLEEARRSASLDPLVFGAFLVRSGDCHGGVAGSEAATADVLRAGSAGRRPRARASRRSRRAS